MNPSALGNIPTLIFNQSDREVTEMNVSGTDRSSGAQGTVTRMDGSGTLLPQAFYPTPNSSGMLSDRNVRALSTNYSAVNNPDPIEVDAETRRQKLLKDGPAAAPVIKLNAGLAVPLLQHMLKNCKGNYVSSPFSLALPLTIVLAGSAGETKKEADGLILTAETESMDSAIYSLASLTRGFVGSGLVRSCNYIYIKNSFNVTDGYAKALGNCQNFLLASGDRFAQPKVKFDTDV